MPECAHHAANNSLPFYHSRYSRNKHGGDNEQELAEEVYRRVKQPLFYTLDNDMYSLLVSHGANVNCIAPKGAHYGERKTLLDVVDDYIAKLKMNINPPAPVQAPKENAGMSYNEKRLELYSKQLDLYAEDSYERYCWDYTYYDIRPQPVQETSKPDNAAEEEKRINKHKKELQRFETMRDYLIAHGAKSFDVLFPDEESAKRRRSDNGHGDNQRTTPKSTVPPTEPSLPHIFSYTLPGKNSNHVPRVEVQAEEEPAYTALFRAVWNNDSATVKRLTCADSSDPERHLLHVGVHNRSSHSLLYIACLRGHASMAALLLQIADNQYASISTEKGKDKKEKAINNFSLGSYTHAHDDGSDYSDEDGSNYGSDEGESDDEERLAALRDRDLPQMPWRPLENTMPPHRLLIEKHFVYFGRIAPDGWIEYPPSLDEKDQRRNKATMLSLTALQVAAMRGDLEVVRALLKATKKFKHGMEVNKIMRSDAVQALLDDEHVHMSRLYTTVLSSISLAVMFGHEEIIDLLIEEGAAGNHFSGIDIYRGCDDIDQDTQLSTQDNYLGLNVDGKKKKGWLSKHNPYTRDSRDLPLLRIAISANNHRSMEYLLGDRPVEALRRFAQKHPHDRRASVLTTKEEIEAVRDRLLGIGIVGEPSPLHVAVAAEQPDALLYLLRHYKQVYQQEPSKFLSLVNGSIGRQIATPLYMAIVRGAYKCFDILLEFGADPLATFDGWNMAHRLAFDNDHKKLRYIASKVSADDWHQLMSSQAARCERTPLAVAVAKLNYAAIHTILELLPDPNILRVFDADCELPLFLAIKEQNPFVVGQLIDKIRAVDMWPLLNIENGAGLTAYDFCQQMLITHFHYHGPSTDAPTQNPFTVEGCMEMVRSYDPDSKDSKMPSGGASEVHDLMMAVHAEVAGRNIPRRPIELHELQQLIRTAASESRRLSKMYYYSRRHDKRLTSPTQMGHVTTYMTIWRIQPGTQPIATDEPVKMRYCVPDIVAIYG
ncbi:hypothetical protein SYNPS1DRAFT_29635 [Syncephalis pseudoplumigaleata]|uniref:Uncharacterized protein n=1 Tax=Syncephalis pseudoplumigaleata TaxID=1712513 RepID=A0A4P9YXJ8_9FUNG|nr:hypothetical protein SYNPS1DRAFT_29635 [Syncephalis pseudoplumigaleata]|eukprot:RKP24605.1 hypothetical protein SYNPS1DRAFT_29635 [Syncephalis pseudoplumigaleata]